MSGTADTGNHSPKTWVFFSVKETQEKVLLIANGLSLLPSGTSGGEAGVAQAGGQSEIAPQRPPS